MEKSWETVKLQFCDRIKTEVALEAEVVYPPDTMPDQSPRILAHRCSHGTECCMMNKASCVWSGTNPGYDPFVAG